MHGHVDPLRDKYRRFAVALSRSYQTFINSIASVYSSK